MSIVTSSSNANTSPPVTIAHNSMHTFGTSLLTVVLGFVTSVVIARMLGPTGKGSFDLITASTMLLATVLSFSLSSGITYVVARGVTKARRLTLHVTWTALLQAAVGLALVALLRKTPYSTSFLPAELGDLPLLVVPVLVLVTLLSTYWRAILAGRHEFVRINIREITWKVLFLICLAPIAQFSSAWTLSATHMVIWANVLVSGLAAVLFLHAINSLPESKLDRGDSSGFRAATAYALPCYLGNLTQFLNYRLDVFIVSYFGGTEAVGLYGLAVATAQLIWLLPNSVATVLFPSIAGSKERDRGSAERTAFLARTSFLLCLAAALVLALGSGVLLPAIYGDRFAASIAPLLWLLPGIAVFGIATVTAAYLNGIGKPRLNLYVALVGLVVTVVLDLTLIPARGITGAAIASTASYSLSAVLTLWLFVRESGLSVRKVLTPMRDDADVVVHGLRLAAGRMPLIGARPAA